jgi:hypothetical protein
MTRCGENGPHGIMTGMPQCILKHLHRSARTLTAPKTLFLGFFVQASAKVLFLTLYYMMQRPSLSHLIAVRYFIFAIMSVMIIKSFCKQKFYVVR